MKHIPLLSRMPRFSRILLAVLASVAFGGCSPHQKAAPQPEPTVPLTGMVTYRERMAPTGLRGGEGVCQRGWMCAFYRERVPS